MTQPLSRDAILYELSIRLPQLRTRFGVQRIGLFGSWVRDEATAASDVDLLVEMDPPRFRAYMDLKFLLEELFEREVDLVLADGLKPRMKPIVLEQVVYA